MEGKNKISKTEFKIEVRTIDLVISISYIIENLTLEDIATGMWLFPESNLVKVMSPLIKKKNCNLLEEFIGNMVNDNFDETFPFKSQYNINEFREDILIDTKKKTDLVIIINKVE